VVIGDPQYWNANDERTTGNADTVTEINCYAQKSTGCTTGPNGTPIRDILGVIVAGDLTQGGLDGRGECIWLPHDCVAGGDQWGDFVANFGLTGSEGALKVPVFEGYGNHDQDPWKPPSVSWTDHWAMRYSDAGYAEPTLFSCWPSTSCRAAIDWQRPVVSQVETRNSNRVVLDGPSARSITNSGPGGHYSWDWGGIHFVQLNEHAGEPGVPGPRSSYAQDSLGFLRSDLSTHAANNEPVVIVQHFGFDPFSTGADAEQATISQTSGGTIQPLPSDSRIKVADGQCLDTLGHTIGKKAVVTAADCQPSPTSGGPFVTLTGEIRGLADKCLDLQNGDVTRGVVLNACNGGPNQRWTYNSDRIAWAGSVGGYCLDVVPQSGGAPNSVQVTVSICSSSTSQQWFYDTSYERYTNQAFRGFCLDVRLANTGNGTAVQIFGCNGTGAQRWTFPQDSQSFVGPSGYIEGPDQQCIDVINNRAVLGTGVRLYGCNKSQAQTWTFDDDGTLRFRNGYCLSAVVGAQATLAFCDLHDHSQLWTENVFLTPSGDLAYRIEGPGNACLEAPSSGGVEQLESHICNDTNDRQWWSPIVGVFRTVAGQCLDANGGGSHAVHLWGCDQGNTNQLWTFTPESELFNPLSTRGYLFVTGDWWSIDERNALAKTISPYNVVAFFTGHEHPTAALYPFGSIDTFSTRASFFSAFYYVTMDQGVMTVSLRSKDQNGTWRWSPSFTTTY
jgi:cytolysin (calcineurin-like family phosphatase)